MKSRQNPKSRLQSLLAASAALAFAASSARAVDYTWDGGTGNWSDTNWNTATASGPTTAGNTATINSGNVTVNVGGPGSVDSITLGSGAQLNLYNGDGGIYAYGYFPNLVLQGGTVNGGSATYHAYGASILTNVTVSGSAASTITGASWFNMDPTTTFTVADATGDSSTDLLVSTPLRGPVYGGNDWAYDTTKLIKEGAGTMEVTVHSYFRGGLDLNNGTLKLSGGNGGYGFFDGTVNVNSGTTLSMTSDGSGFGYQNDWKPDAVNIVGGTVTDTGGNHVWGISGGVNMTGGTLQSAGLQWNYTNLNTLASADTATVSGPLNLRGDGGYTTMAVDVADGAAATDLLISGNITQLYAAMGITKSGAGTMELSGTGSYTGSTTVNGGTLVLSGASCASPNIAVNATGALSLSAPIVDDAASVSIASGASVHLGFSGNDIIGSLEIAGSGPLPPDTYDANHTTYGSYFSGGGSLVILSGADGTWTSLVDGIWADTANWSAATIANGADRTATFNAATGVTVTLASNLTIGNLAFDVSDYTIAGGGTLTLASAVNTPAISVGASRTAGISAGLAGTNGMEKTGQGTLVLSGVKTYTGGTTVTSGTLELAGGNSGNSIIRGPLSIASGATVALTGGDGSGFGWNNPVTSITIDGGTLNAAGTSHIGFGAAASVSMQNGGAISGNWQWNGDSLLSFASYGDSTNTISGNLTLRSDAGVGHTFEVEDGAAAVDLEISANLSDQWPEYTVVLASVLNKTGSGTLRLGGTNTYDGDTVVYNGALEVAATGSLHFRPTTNGATNSVSGTNASTLSFLGTVDLDLGAAVAAGGNEWTLFNLTSFSSATFTPAAVTSTLGAFSEVSPGTWEYPVTDAKWVFTTNDGKLAYVVTATDYDTWKSANGVTGGPNDDDDGDGLSNNEEYAFGLDPTGASSLNPIAVPLDKTAGTFSYTRRTQSLTGLAYSVWYSTDLSGWTEDTGAVEGTPSVSGEVETVPVTLTNSLLTNPSLFIQVRAE